MRALPSARSASEVTIQATCLCFESLGILFDESSAARSDVAAYSGSDFGHKWTV
ncbi:hypothetical protein PENSPDRAFT_653118 [Peniophora sp. CONT]|nr:hypothetical protein PENSPDRAFT_653118 [Peniophora sp. CONT]